VIPLRIYLAGAAAVLALGGTTALAAPALMGSVSHGNGVSGAVGTCSQSSGSARGACVSAAAESRTTSSAGAHGQSGAESESGSKPSSSSNDTHGDAVSAAARSCAHGTASDRDAHGDCVSAVARSNSSHAGGH
jgi:hypothetical protein